MKRRPLSKKAREWNVEKRRVIRLLRTIDDAIEFGAPASADRGTRIATLRFAIQMISQDSHRVR